MVFLIVRYVDWRLSLLSLFQDEDLKFSWLQICLIANVGPDTADEVFALIPALKVLYYNHVFMLKREWDT